MGNGGVKPTGSSGQMPIIPPEVEVTNKTNNILNQIPPPRTRG